MAWDDVVKVGGAPELSVTKQTNILVIGEINPAVLAPGMVTTGRTAKAFALQDKGQDIEIMTEDDFSAAFSQARRFRLNLRQMNHHRHIRREDVIANEHTPDRFRKVR
jgi:hypothetical protein